MTPFNRPKMLFFAAALAVCAGVAMGETDRATLRFPFPVVRGGAGQEAAYVALDRPAYRRLKALDRVAITDFPLPGGKTAELELHQIEVFTPDAQIVLATPDGEVSMDRPDVAIFAGHVAGRAESSVFLGFTPTSVNGLIQDGQATYMVSSGANGAALDVAVFDLASVVGDSVDAEAVQCGSEGLFAPGWDPDDYPAEPSNGRGGVEPMRTVRMAIETDWEFTGTLFGGDTEQSSAYAAVLVGAVSEIYLRDVRTALRVSYLRIWSNASDPWSASDTGSQLTQFRSYWNSNMGGVSRDVTHFFSGRSLGGGIAYVGALCSPSWNYAVSANLSSSFPYPLVDNNWNNWTPYVIAHELGHNFGAPHTHSASPPIDGCGSGDCSVTPNGTIMSYCHLCAGGLNNILLRFHDRMISQYILPYLNFSTSCGFEPEPPVADELFTNRYLIFESGNSGLVGALQVELAGSDDSPASVGSTWWVGVPDVNGVSKLVDTPVYRDWGVGLIYVGDCRVVPAASYNVRMIGEGWNTADTGSYSSPGRVDTVWRPFGQFWGDAVGVFDVDRWTPANGLVNFNDVNAAIAAFQATETAPDVVRLDVHPQSLNYLVNFADIDLIIKAFQSAPYPYAAPADCP